MRISHSTSSGSKDAKPLMSSPAQKVSPAPLRMTTRHSRSVSISFIARLSSLDSSLSSALWTSGRFNVTVVTGPSLVISSFPDDDGVVVMAPPRWIEDVLVTCSTKLATGSTIKQVTFINRPDASVATDSDAVFRATEVIGDAWSWLLLREAVLY